VAWAQIAQCAATGVEMALVTFLVSLLLWLLARRPLAELDWREAALIGFVGALTVLARMDALALAPFLLLAVLGRWDLKRMAAAALGAWPLYAYLAFNYATTGHLATTATYAKSIAPRLDPEVFVTFTLPLIWQQLAIALSAIGLLLFRPPAALTEDARRLLLAVCAAPVAQLLLTDIMSGWWMFMWYLYLSLVAGGVLAALLVEYARTSPMPRLTPFVAAALLAVSAGLGGIGGQIWRSVQADIVRVTDFIEAFSRTHPGVYAMGDGAGVPGWVLDQPVVHLEGLMMSHAYIGRIKSERPMSETLRDYGVDYLVVNNVEAHDASGCPILSAPHEGQASPRAPKMRMTTCVAPVAMAPKSVYYQVRIYRIDRATGLAVAL
jgi:hypothetical protein